MSFMTIVKQLLFGGKYSEERIKAQKWVDEETQRIINSQCLAKVAQRVFANSNMPEKITIMESGVAWYDKMPYSTFNEWSGWVRFSEFGFKELNRSLNRSFITAPSEFSWEDRGFRENVDQVKVFADALCNREEAKNQYYVLREDMAGYGFDNYHLIKKNVKTQLSEW